MDISERSQGEHAIRGVVPGAWVRVPAEPTRVAVPDRDHVREPRVELISQGDIVQAIDLTCICRHKIRLRCIYS